MMGQNRSGMRISSVSSAGYVSSGGGQRSLYRTIGCPTLPTRNSVTFFMFLLSFGTNIYFYIENQELLHNLAYKELHEVVKIQECQKLMAIKGKQFNEQVLRHVMKNQNNPGGFNGLNGFAPDTGPDDIGFNSQLDSRPLHVQAMPDPRHRFVPNINVNPAPILSKLDNNFAEFDDTDGMDKYDDYQPIQEALDADARYDDLKANQHFAAYNPNPRIQQPAATPPPREVTRIVTQAPYVPYQAQQIDDSISKEKEEAEMSVISELKDLLKVISDVGPEQFAEKLIAQNNQVMAEKIEHIEQFETTDGNIDLGQVEAYDLSEIKEEINEIVEEVAVQEIVEEEASELVKEDFIELTNEIDSELATAEISEAEFMDKYEVDTNQYGSDTNQYESDTNELPSLDLGYDQPAAPAESIPNDPWFDAPVSVGDGTVDETVEETFEEPLADTNSDYYGENQTEESNDAEISETIIEPVLETGFENLSPQEDDQTSDSSLNLERPIGTQEFQSQRAENLPTETEEILTTTTTTTTTTTPEAKENLLPMMTRQVEPSQPPLVELQQQQMLQPLLPNLDNANPLVPIVAIGGNQIQDRRLDGDDDPEPFMAPNMNQRFGQANGLNNNFGMQNQYGMPNQQFGMQQNQYGMQNQQQRYGYGQQPIQNLNGPTKDPDEVYPVGKKQVPALQPGEWPTDCNHLYNLGVSQNGVYIIQPNKYSNDTKKKVRCDFKYSGGWTVIQHRFDGSQDFYQTWEQYKNGFGSEEGEYWLGLESIHLLSSRAEARIRIDLTDVQGNHAYVEHENFFVDDEATGYKLHAGIKRHGDLGDSFQAQSGEKFTTFDKDNDSWSLGNCASELHAGGWFSRCSYSNLNGRYYANGKSCSSPGNCIKDGIYWAKFPVDYRPPDDMKPTVHLSSWIYSMTSVTMSILVDPNKP